MEYPNLSAAKYVCLDIETYDPKLKEMGVGWVRGIGNIVGVAIGADNADTWYYPYSDRLMDYLQTISQPILGFNLGYDLGWLLHYKCNLLRNSHLDAMAGAQVIDNSLEHYNLDYVCETWLNEKKYSLADKYGDKWKNQMHLLPVEEVAWYAKRDVQLTMMLHEYEKTQFDKYGLWKVYELECKLIPIVIKMKEQGVALDLEYLQILKKQFRETEFAMVKQLKWDVGIYDLNFNSGRSVANIFRRLQIDYPRTTLGAPSFTSDWLDNCDHPVAQRLRKIRQINKLRSTFLDGLERLSYNGRVHPDYYASRSDDGGTISARFSCAHPNKQQIPTRTEEGALIRRIFLPNRDSRWACFDYSQQEPRLSVHYAAKLELSGIDFWVDKFNNDPETDFYTFILELAGIERQDSKTITLARMYGIGADKTGRKLGVDKDTAWQYINKFDKHVPWMKELMDRCIKTAADKGYIRSYFGRRFMYLPTKAYVMLNRLIQGGAAEQTKQAMIDIYEQTGMVPISQIHDELNYNMIKDIDGQIRESGPILITDIMKNAIQLKIPVKVDVGIADNWGDAKKETK